MKDKPTKIFILGAGASRSAGLPLGIGVSEYMGHFLQQLPADDAHCHLRAAIERTLTAMKKHDATTIDQLVAAACDKDIAEEAKLAMSVVMLSHERALQLSNLVSYQSFLAEIFQDDPHDDWNETLSNSNVRILTFNYDRVFEMAFQEWLRCHDEDVNDVRPIYRRLNSGFGDPLNCTINRERFTLLKLHGGAGTYARNGDSGFNHPIPHTAIPWQIEMQDSVFFKENGERRDDSQIVFPTEKNDIDLFESVQSGAESFEKYLRSVWHAASDFMRAASEITVIGYSIQKIDQQHFKRLLEHAPHNTSTTIWNTCSTPANNLRELCPHLRVKHRNQVF